MRSSLCSFESSWVENEQTTLTSTFPLPKCIILEASRSSPNPVDFFYSVAMSKFNGNPWCPPERLEEDWNHWTFSVFKISSYKPETLTQTLTLTHVKYSLPRISKKLIGWLLMNINMAQKMAASLYRYLPVCYVFHNQRLCKLKSIVYKITEIYYITCINVLLFFNKIKEHCLFKVWF